MTTISQSGVTQLEFNQAMRDFKIMFPEMDEDVIEVVLRSNNGAVDATIDQLLIMNKDSEHERLRTNSQLQSQSQSHLHSHNITTENNEIPPRYSPATPPPSYNQAVPVPNVATLFKSTNLSANMSNNISANILTNMSTNMSENESNQRSNLSPKISSSLNKKSFDIDYPSKDSLRYIKKWKPPLLGPLPNTFLRVQLGENQQIINTSNIKNRSQVGQLNSALLQQKMEENQRQRQLSCGDDPELSQYLEDERIAIFLQNEEFVRELRKNKDFMSTLELDTASAHRTSSNQSTDNASHHSPHSDNDAAFKETLKHMGKVSRRKFAQLASIFSRRKRRSFQHLNDGNNPSRDNLLIKDDEYTQFQNEGSDTEDIKESWGNNNNSSSSSSHCDQRFNTNISLRKT